MKKGRPFGLESYLKNLNPHLKTLLYCKYSSISRADEQPLHHTRSKEDCIGGPILSFDELGLRAQQSKRVDGLMPRQSDISRMAVNEPGKRASSGTHRKNFERLLVAGSVLYLILTLVFNSSLAKNAPLWVGSIGVIAL